MLEVLMILLGILSLVGGFLLEGGHFVALVEPTALLIVLGGTISAVGLSFSMKELKKVPKLIMKIFTKDKVNLLKEIDYYIGYYKELSTTIKRDGKLALEEEIENNNMLGAIGKKGLTLILDNVETDTIRRILENYIDLQEEEYELESAIFESAGGYAPTMGIIGTVMGLVHVLGNLDDPNTLGPKIAVAFIATLYGVASANLLWLPIANKLKLINQNKIKESLIFIEGTLCLIDGISNVEIEERLQSILG